MPNTANTIMNNQLIAYLSKLIITDAADPRSPLHSLFEWDNHTAAEKYRLGQAQDLTENLIIAPQNSNNGVSVNV